MNTSGSIEQRLRALEDQAAIYQVICGHGYATDGLNSEIAGTFFAEDGVYEVSGTGGYRGRDQISAIATSQSHRQLSAGGSAHITTLPYIVIKGDRASATCHALLLRNGENGFYIMRLSAVRIELSRKPEGGWQIEHRQNIVLQGDPAGPALLARLNEGPSPEAR